MKRLFYVIFVTFFAFWGCQGGKMHLHSVKNQLITVQSETLPNSDIEQFILPYREAIHKELESVLAYNPSDLVKEATALNVPISNFMADAIYEQANFVFSKRMNQNLDFVVLNWGGIRSSIPKGNVTKRTVFNIMPFENRLVAVQITGKKVLEMADYLASEHIPNPVSKHILLQINTQNQVVNFKVNAKEIDPDALYWVGTTDYLLRGGDRMYFFKEAPQVLDLEYQFRNALMDYFIKIDTLKTQTDDRFIKK